MNPLPDKSRLSSLADLLLVTVTVFWGTSFALVKEALALTDVSNLVFLRFTLACLLLLPVAWLRRADFRAGVLKPGLICGLLLFGAFASQALGLVHTSASRSGFITGLNVILVPVFSLFLLRRAPARTALAGALTAFAGLYLLTAGGGPGMAGFNRGDGWTFVCAVLIAAHILALGRFSPGRDSFWLAFVQLAILSALSLLWAGAEGKLNLALGKEVYLAAAFLAASCTIFAYLAQTWAQKHTTPTRTAIIFTLEPVFAALFAWWWLGDRLTRSGLIGGGLIVAGLILAEIKPQAWNGPAAGIGSGPARAAQPDQP